MNSLLDSINRINSGSAFSTTPYLTRLSPFSTNSSGGLLDNNGYINPLGNSSNSSGLLNNSGNAGDAGDPGFFGKGGMFGNIMQGVGLLASAFDMYNKYRANRENIKNMKVARERALYDLDQTKKEYNRLNQMRAGTTASFNNSKVF